MVSALGFFFDGFDTRRGLYAWQAVIMTRNFAVTAALSALLDPIEQLSACLLVVMVASWLHLWFKPYAVAIFNTLETVSLATIAATLAATVGMQPSAVSGQGASAPLTPVQTAIFALLLIVNAVVIAVFLYFATLARDPAPSKSKPSISASALAPREPEEKSAPVSVLSLPSSRAQRVTSQGTIELSEQVSLSPTNKLVVNNPLARGTASSAGVPLPRRKSFSTRSKRAASVGHPGPSEQK